MKLLELVNTDPLAQGALVGLAVTILVSIGIFTFLMTRRNPASAARTTSLRSTDVRGVPSP